MKFYDKKASNFYCSEILKSIGAPSPEQCSYLQHCPLASLLVTALVFCYIQFLTKVTRQKKKIKQTNKQTNDAKIPFYFTINEE